jgi:hypothetical protein
MADLARSYYTLGLPTAFSTEDNLSAAVSDSAGVMEWLEKQDAYTLHSPVRNKFHRNPYTFNNLMDVWECHLIDVPQIARYNYSYRYIPSAIEVFSKYLHMVSLMSRTGKAVGEAFRSLLDDPRYTARRPLTVQTDKSRGFQTSRFVTCCDAKESNIGQVKTWMLNAQLSKGLIELYEINSISTSVKNVRTDI